MAVELAPVWINPYTIRKSRTGGVIARLLSLCSGELVAARMFSPSRELVEKYCRLIPLKGSGESRKIRDQIRTYIQKYWMPDRSSGDQPRVMMLIFRGNNVISELAEQVVGPIRRSSISGETVRDTYGDYIKDSEGNILYFEPAVFIVPEKAAVEKALKLWARYSDRDGGILKKACSFPSGVVPETTLVMLKPGNFEGPSSLAGNVIDIISRTGLRIIGARIVHMSIEQAMEFYRPVAKALPERMKSWIVEKLKHCLGEALDFDIPEITYKRIGDELKALKANREFNTIIQTMTGIDPDMAKGIRAKSKPGPEKCLALIYQGDRAISRIRSVLGATDPNKAASATIRRMYAHSISNNVAHASDSRSNVAREIRIIRMEENNFKQIINGFYRK
ncbi:MAG: nucleoside-diphosphate kinase [Candidatus Euphemobacter frigidus]|nr:nucleoside-diphosphate kinase [Candidatus Euphemobacter frigidus]MDP8274951.1 nucleoside-diphosphate kinase [Candidatus Euphemobacter frigidus]